MVLPLVFALAATVTFAAPAGEEAAAVEKEMVLDPSTGEMISAPEYGGTFTYALKEEPGGIDAVLAGGWGSIIYNLVLENLTIQGLVNAKRRARLCGGPPADAHHRAPWPRAGRSPTLLPTSSTSARAFRFHDKAPVNGRLFTAEDVEFNFHRLFGIGSGYTERSEFY